MTTTFRRVARVTAAALLALAVGLPSAAHAATRPTATWKVTELATNATYTTKSLFATDSGGTQTWSASGACAVKSKKIVTSSTVGKCKLTVKIAAYRAFASRSATKTLTVSAPTTSQSAAGCASTYKFVDLSSASGAGSAYAKPKVAASCSGDTLTVTSNGMIGYTFVAKTPNALREQAYTWKVTTTPKVAASSTSIENQLGTIAFTVTGLPIYGPTEGPVPQAEAFGDPVYNNILDTCKGHTGYNGDYHYHAILSINSCYLDETIVGYANDGFPIYSNPGYTYTSGYKMTGIPKSYSWKAYSYVGGGANTLDECNGRTDENGGYRYYITETFPYVIGCYKGTPTRQVGAAAAPMVMKSSTSFVCEI
ncbi:MAG: YHYH protein [Actinobacteria bacterium]|nr:YHYH protein [Actinomycetota bacterium]